VATDTQAMGLLIRMMPLLLREFALRVEPAQFFADTGYAQAILDTAETATEPRLKGYAAQLRERMAALSAGPPGAARSAGTPQQQRASEPPAATPAPDPQDPHDPAHPPARKYTRTLR
jgi:hypothetical protein